MNVVFFFEISRHFTRKKVRRPPAFISLIFYQRWVGKGNFALKYLFFTFAFCFNHCVFPFCKAKSYDRTKNRRSGSPDKFSSYQCRKLKLRIRCHGNRIQASVLIQLYKSAAMELDCFLPGSFKTRGKLKTRIHCTNHLKRVLPMKKSVG